MDFQLKNCLAEGTHLLKPMLQEILQYPYRLTFVLLDLGLLEVEVNRQGRSQVIINTLTEKERALLDTFSSVKRQKEWLGGRFAAKYAAAGLIAQADVHNTINHWSGCAIDIDKNSRPILAATNKSLKPSGMPDISISHSGSMAAAMAVEKGYCGIDIQKVTRKAVKVRERFCTHSEMQILQDSFSVSPEEQLTKLWAAKETLRKASNMSALPGFLELELIEIKTGPSNKEPEFRCFVFYWNKTGDPSGSIYTVAVTRIGNYALALTARGDTVG